jgi:hypothetical protein
MYAKLCSFQNLSHPPVCQAHALTYSVGEENWSSVSTGLDRVGQRAARPLCAEVYVAVRFLVLVSFRVQALRPPVRRRSRPKPMVVRTTVSSQPPKACTAYSRLLSDCPPSRQRNIVRRHKRSRRHRRVPKLSSR